MAAEIRRGALKLLVLFVTAVVAMMPCRADSIPDSLRILSRATRIETARLGEGVPSTIFKEYRAACELEIKPMGDELTWLIKNGSPAGRVYACFIAWEGSFSAGLARFESLEGDKAVVEYQSGCKVTGTTVGEIARQFRASNRYLDFPTSVFCEKPIAAPESFKPNSK